MGCHRKFCKEILEFHGQSQTSLHKFLKVNLEYFNRVFICSEGSRGFGSLFQLHFIAKNFVQHIMNILSLRGLCFQFCIVSKVRFSGRSGKIHMFICRVIQPMINKCLTINQYECNLQSVDFEEQSPERSNHKNLYSLLSSFQLIYALMLFAFKDLHFSKCCLVGKQQSISTLLISGRLIFNYR